MKISLEGRRSIQTWEGLRLEAYRPLPDDVWTIGYGHTLTAYEGLVITEAQAEKLFDGDIAEVECCINQKVNVSLNQRQFDVLCSFVFNVGCAAFQTSTLLKELNAGRYERVPDQLKRWVNSGGKKIPGLVARRAKESTEWSIQPMNVVAANARPEVPMGRSAMEIMKTSKTAKGATVVGLGSGTISVGAVLGEVNAVTAEYTQTIDSLKNAVGESVGLLLVSGIVLAAAGFIIYNRLRDSRIGRAY